MFPLAIVESEMQKLKSICAAAVVLRTCGWMDGWIHRGTNDSIILIIRDIMSAFT